MYCDYVLFMRKLAEEASKAAHAEGSSMVTEDHVDKVAEVRCLSSRPGLAHAITPTVTDTLHASDDRLC